MSKQKLCPLVTRLPDGRYEHTSNSQRGKSAAAAKAERRQFKTAKRTLGGHFCCSRSEPRPCVKRGQEVGKLGLWSGLRTKERIEEASAATGRES